MFFRCLVCRCIVVCQATHTVNNCFFTQPYCFNRDHLATINSFLDILFANYAKVLPIRVDLEIMQDYVPAYGYRHWQPQSCFG